MGASGGGGRGRGKEEGRKLGQVEGVGEREWGREGEEAGGS